MRRVILLFHRIINKAFLYVVADHGWSDFHATERRKTIIYISHDLLKIEPHIWQLLISRQLEGADFFVNNIFVFHMDILLINHKLVNEFLKSS